MACLISYCGALNYAYYIPIILYIGGYYDSLILL